MSSGFEMETTSSVGDDTTKSLVQGSQFVSEKLGLYQSCTVDERTPESWIRFWKLVTRSKFHDTVQDVGISKVKYPKVARINSQAVWSSTKPNKVLTERWIQINMRKLDAVMWIFDSIWLCIALPTFQYSYEETIKIIRMREQSSHCNYNFACKDSLPEYHTRFKSVSDCIPLAEMK